MKLFFIMSRDATKKGLYPKSDRGPLYLHSATDYGKGREAALLLFFHFDLGNLVKTAFGHPEIA